MKKLCSATRSLAVIALALASMGVVGSAAAGEPKNQPPFTRAATVRTLTEHLGAVRYAVSRRVMSEPKNQIPFTRR